MTFYSRKGILYIRKNGKRVSTKLEDTPKNRKLVESYHKNDEFFNKFNINNGVPTVSQLLNQVLEDKEVSVKKSTFNLYLFVATSKIYPFFKDKFVDRITPLDISNFYKINDDSLTNRISSLLLKKVFQIAIIQNFVKYSPLIITLPTKKKSNYNKQPFTLEEVKALLKCNSKIKNFLGISISTGLRAGEVIGLKWDDIDFVNNKISINRTIYRGVEQTPKTKASMAVIDLPFESKIYFENQFKVTGLYNTYVFLNDGKRFDGITIIRHLFYTLLKELGFAHRGLHQTRHTFASLKICYGEKLEWVSYMLRHKSPAFTQSVYYKYIPNDKEKRIILDF